MSLFFNGFCPDRVLFGGTAGMRLDQGQFFPWTGRAACMKKKTRFS
jgi:hypothetical protein